MGSAVVFLIVRTAEVLSRQVSDQTGLNGAVSAGHLKAGSNAQASDPSVFSM
jgi:hypothetical protein